MEMRMEQRFANKTILITGGNSGMGFSTAKRIVQEGGRVIITGRDAETLKKSQQELGEKAFSIQVEISDVSQLEQMAKTIAQKYGKIDGVFANAGIAKALPPEEVTEKIFDELFNVNVKGVYFTLQKTIPLLSVGSAVVVNSSVAASRGGPRTSVYGATKAAVRSMARTFSSSTLPLGIRVNAVSPGPIETPIWSRPGAFPKETVDATKKALAETNPMKRYGTPEEMAGAVAFLLSSESSYIAGTELMVDGGLNQLMEV
jgi:NAD(P)-dependent dehydrogenase (short-subunit alcohol dehydrogenase family)